MPIPYFRNDEDGRKVAWANELKVLNVLRVFGHLRRSEIATACWPRSSEKSAYEMAARTVRRMLDDGQLLERINSLGGCSLVLSPKGAGVLELAGTPAEAGYKLAFDGPQFFHRTLGTNYLLSKGKHGHEVFGEYAIIKGMSPVNRDFLRKNHKKVPDGLIVYSSEVMGYREGYRGADWVEVESAYKNYEDLARVLALLTKKPELNEAGTLTLNKLVFVYDSRQQHDRPILRAAQQFLKEHPHLEAEFFLDAVVLAKCFVDPPFAYHGVVEESAKSVLEKVHFQDQADDLER